MNIVLFHFEMILNVSFPQAEVLPEALDSAGKHVEAGVDGWMGNKVSGVARLGVLFQICFVLLAIRRLDGFIQTFGSAVEIVLAVLQWGWTIVLLGVSLTLTLRVLADKLNITTKDDKICEPGI